MVGLHPWSTIGMSLLVCAALSVGLFFFKKEADVVALYASPHSIIRLNTEWIKEHYSDDFRFESIIFAANESNILQPSVLVRVRSA